MSEEKTVLTALKQQLTRNQSLHEICSLKRLQVRGGGSRALVVLLVCNSSSQLSLSITE